MQEVGSQPEFSGFCESRRQNWASRVTKELRLYKTKYGRGENCPETPLGRFAEISLETFSEVVTSRCVCEQTTRSQGESHPTELEPSTHMVLGTMIVPTSHAGSPPDSRHGIEYSERFASITRNNYPMLNTVLVFTDTRHKTLNCFQVTLNYFQETAQEGL